MREIIGFADYISVDPQDQSRGSGGGFQGHYFTVKGVTDRAFATVDEAIQAIRKRRPDWHDTGAWSGFDRVFAHPTRDKFLCVGFGGVLPIYSDKE